MSWYLPRWYTGEVKGILSFYLDDVTLGGSIDDLRHDPSIIECVGAEIGLYLNKEKSDIVCANPDTSNVILSFLMGALVVDPAVATFLGSSVEDMSVFCDGCS